MEQDRPNEVTRAQSSTADATGVWQRVLSWDSRLSVTKGLTAVTLLTGFFGGYFQYLNAYEQKVGEQAKADMQKATETFIEISNAFAEVQMLQENILPARFGTMKAQTAPAFIPVDTKTLEPFADYWKARTALRRNGAIFARKAEIYIDWPSDMKRDAAAEHTLDQDPMTATLLTKYNFDCESEANLPQFRGTTYRGSDLGRPSEELCNDPGADGPKAYVPLCARKPDGTVDPLQKVVSLNWWSAKHHVLVMNHCFEALRSQPDVLVPSGDLPDNRRPDAAKPTVSNEQRLQFQARRLDAFMTLTMAQLDSIRVRYRPTGFVCHVPVVRDAVGYFSNQCLPIEPVRNDRT